MIFHCLPQCGSGTWQAALSVPAREKNKKHPPPCAQNKASSMMHLDRKGVRVNYMASVPKNSHRNFTVDTDLLNLCRSPPEKKPDSVCLIQWFLKFLVTKPSFFFPSAIYFRPGMKGQGNYTVGMFSKDCHSQGMVAHSCYPSSQEMETGEGRAAWDS